MTYERATVGSSLGACRRTGLVGSARERCHLLRRHALLRQGLLTGLRNKRRRFADDDDRKQHGGDRDRPCRAGGGRCASSPQQ